MRGFLLFKKLSFALRWEYVYGRADFGAAGKVDFAHIAKGNGAVFKGKKGVVVAKANIFARHHSGATLAHYYLASFYYFPSIQLNAKVFWLGCTEVFC